jgi:uncharacterized coiled-coil DUF342 family protein
MLKWSKAMKSNYAKDLFQLQSELVDKKVDMAVSSAIDRVIEQISGLRTEMHSLNSGVHKEIHALTNNMHGLRNEMHQGFSSLDKRVVAIETKLGMVNETQKEIRTKFIDYSFKAGWLVLGVAISYALMQFHILMK